MRIEVTACTVLILAACTEYTVPLPDDAEYFPRPVLEVARWQVRQEGEDLGFLVLLEIRDPAGPIRFYRVENAGRQWVGQVGLDGRFSRRVPFQDEEEDLGIYGMRRGLAVLYQVENSVGHTVEISPLEGAASKASLPRIDRN